MNYSLDTKPVYIYRLESGEYAEVKYEKSYIVEIQSGKSGSAG